MGGFNFRFCLNEDTNPCVSVSFLTFFILDTSMLVSWKCKTFQYCFFLHFIKIPQTNFKLYFLFLFVRGEKSLFNSLFSISHRVDKLKNTVKPKKLFEYQFNISLNYSLKNVKVISSTVELLSFILVNGQINYPGNKNFVSFLVFFSCMMTLSPWAFFPLQLG